MYEGLKNVNDPYQICPTFETDNFIFRLVREEDATDLLDCYSDPKAQQLFNSDNCLSGFQIETVERMLHIIQFWLQEYEKKYYIRFCIVDKNISKSVGTIEFFTRNDSFEIYGSIGILRIDLASEYETKEVITEILLMIEEHFYDCFEATSIATKTILIGEQRISALLNLGFNVFKDYQIIPYKDYFLKTRNIVLR